MDTSWFRNKRWICMAFFALALLLFGKLLRFVLASLLEDIPSGRAFDFILSYLPVVRDGWIIFIYTYFMAVIIIVFAVTKLYYNLKDSPYAGLVFAFAMIITDVMFTVTVLGSPNGLIDVGLLWSFSKDLLPSFHVGAPFVAFLLADRPWVKWFFLGMTVLMAIVVLLLHIHYTIDVLVAPFVFYGLFCLCDKYLKPLLRRFYTNR